MHGALQIFSRYTLKAIIGIAYVAAVLTAAGMIMSHGETAETISDFLAPIGVATVMLIAVVWLGSKGLQALSQHRRHSHDDQA